METWLILVWISVLSFIIASALLQFGSTSKKLPPGPLILPIIGSITWIRRSFSDLEPILKGLHLKHGPVVSLRIGQRPAVFVSDRALARHALVHHGAVFASRPPPIATSRIVSALSISSSSYGPTWRALRRNLTSELLHPARPNFSSARLWVLSLLLARFETENGNGNGSVRVIEHLRHAMFCLLALMCFGDRLEETKIAEIESVQRRILLGFPRFSILNFFPPVTKIVLRKRWDELMQIRKDQDALFLPLVKNRVDAKSIECYVDTLLALHLPTVDDNQTPTATRKLDLKEVVGLCSEFLNGGTDTTSTSLQWIMANLVKHPEIQERVYEEISSSVSSRDVVSEEEAGKLKYLKAVVLEGLRRHPPGHFVLPHAVSEDTNLGGYRIPKKGTINFMVAEMGWDPAVWDDPMAFNPERFVAVDESQNQHIVLAKGADIKMMPFGAGRRICPGSDLALLHLQFFVANLVWKFQWSPDPDHPIDLAEKQEFTVVMKHPLHARLSPRRTPI